MRDEQPRGTRDAVVRQLLRQTLYHGQDDHPAVIGAALVQMMGRLVDRLHLTGRFNDADVAAVLGDDFRPATPEEVAAYAASQPAQPGLR